MGGYNIKGFSFAFGTRKGDLSGERARHSLELLKATGTEWIALCVDQRVETKKSQEIRYNYNRNVTDVELIEFIKYVHSTGMKVCLKPMINCMDGSWRAEINFFDDEGSWAKWFYEYTGYLTHMAEIAEYTGCEMLCLGCEMLGMERQEKHWRELIAKVRAVYSGPLTYNTNHGHEMDATWYDELDYLGTSAYFRMMKNGVEMPANPTEPVMDLTREDMLLSWQRVKKDMEAFSNKYNKPVIFMEIGCRSARGTACQPWDFRMGHLPYDEEEQALFYETCLETFKDTDFFMGFFWWDWSAFVSEDSFRTGNTGFSIYGKKAEQVLKKYYAL
ncbi:MAG: glycoside hydrolase family 113 [Lachnospiraceae bacterium]